MKTYNLLFAIAFSALCTCALCGAVFQGATHQLIIALLCGAVSLVAWIAYLKDKNDGNGYAA